MTPRKATASPESLARRARAAQKRGDLDGAAHLLNRLLKAAPNDLDVLGNLGSIAQRRGDKEKALGYFAKAARAAGGEGDETTKRRSDEGKASDDLATRNLQLATHITNYAAPLGNCGKHSKALRQAERAIAADPAYAPAHQTRAVALEKLGHLAEAEAAYRDALAIDPNLVRALAGLGGRLLAKVEGKSDAATKRRSDEGNALATDDPEHVATPSSRAAEALALLRKAYALAPKDADVSDKLGNALRVNQLFAEAVGVYRALVEARPGMTGARCNLAIALQESGDIDAAIEHLQIALQAKPNDVAAHWNLGLALLLKAHTEGSGEGFEVQGSAAEECDKATKRRSDEGNGIQAAVGKAQSAIPSSLATYNSQPATLSAGWLQFEWRRHLPTDKLEKHKPPQPEWDGRSLTGLRILIRAEQGLGDTLQFIRYAMNLKERGAAWVGVECQPPLVSLLAGACGLDQAFARGMPLPNFDLHVRMMSLPGILGDSSHPSSFIPHPSSLLNPEPPREALNPYLLPDPAREFLWRERLSPLAGLKVGIVWQGNPRYVADGWRSIPLSAFAPLAKTPGVRLIALQRGHGSEQLQEAAAAGMVVEKLNPSPDEAGAFVDTAAIVRELDLVITSDTSLAHLAGAVGAKVWLALSKVPDWRWGLAGDTTRWYPTMRLFRQTQQGDWAGVFARIAEALGALAGVPARVPEVMIPVAPGELADRLTILRLKTERVTDPAKRASVTAEYAALRSAAARALPPSPTLDALLTDLTAANEALWEVEDALRDCERYQRFDEEFIALARAVYHANDRRAAIKRQINTLLGAAFSDEKSYSAY